MADESRIEVGVVLSSLRAAVSGLVVLLATSSSLAQSPPPASQPDPAAAMLALEAGRLAELPVIPLRDTDGRQLGALLDPILVAAAHVQVAIANGDDPGAMARAPRAPMLVVVAYPLPCGGREVSPTAIRLVGSTGRVPALGEIRREGPRDAILPQESLPPGSALRPFQPVPLANMRVEVGYEEADCPDQPRPLVLPVEVTPAQPLARPSGWRRIPPDVDGLMSPENVVVNTWVDRGGTARFSRLVSGPPALATAATAYVDSLRFNPLRVNGVAVSVQGTLGFGFSTTGAPPSPPAVATSNNRSPTIMTEDVPGLTSAKSQCAVSSDNGYGRNSSNPVLVGGNASDGIERERSYLRALRGPRGEGIRSRRIGLVTLGVNASGGLLDAWEVTYAGRPEPVYLYLDMYRFETPKAPAGFICATPIR